MRAADAGLFRRAVWQGWRTWTDESRRSSSVEITTSATLLSATLFRNARHTFDEARRCSLCAFENRFTAIRHVTSSTAAHAQPQHWNGGAHQRPSRGFARKPRPKGTADAPPIGAVLRGPENDQRRWLDASTQACAAGCIAGVGSGARILVV